MERAVFRLHELLTHEATSEAHSVWLDTKFDKLKETFDTRKREMEAELATAKVCAVCREHACVHQL
jgi:hypothetical protein